MGNLCGKESKQDNFSGPGRTLGSAPPPRTERASVPAPSASKGRAAKPSQSNQDASGARRAAAGAAEERARKGTPKGKLGKDLNTQRERTANQTLQQASKDERRQREIDQMTKDRTHG